MNNVKDISWKLKIKGFNNDEPFDSNFRPVEGDIIKLPNQSRRKLVTGVFFDFENEIISFS